MAARSIQRGPTGGRGGPPAPLRHPWARAINLLVPGGGLILIGRVAAGVIIALLFALLANAAAATTLLFPDDLPQVWRSALLGLTAGVYLGAQVRLAQSLRQQRDRERKQRRDGALRQAREHLLRGDADAAWSALQPVRDMAETDMLVAYRIAQVLTARGDVAEARRAWLVLKRIDRHRIYRREIERNADLLGRAGGPDVSDHSLDSRSARA